MSIKTVINPTLLSFCQSVDKMIMSPETLNTAVTPVPACGDQLIVMIGFLPYILEITDVSYGDEGRVHLVAKNVTKSLRLPFDKDEVFKGVCHEEEGVVWEKPDSIRDVGTLVNDNMTPIDYRDTITYLLVSHGPTMAKTMNQSVNIALWLTLKCLPFQVKGNMASLVKESQTSVQCLFPFLLNHKLKKTRQHHLDAIASWEHAVKFGGVQASLIGLELVLKGVACSFLRHISVRPCLPVCVHLAQIDMMFTQLLSYLSSLQPVMLNVAHLDDDVMLVFRDSVAMLRALVSELRLPSSGDKVR